MNRLSAVLSLAREALRPPHPIDPVRPPARHWQPSLWASWLPLRQLENFREIFRALRENRDNLDYAWRILNHGVCDGCSLGTTGMHDWTMENIHVCNVRLRLLRLSTLPALDVARLADAGALAKLGGKALRALGRIPYPMLRRRGEAGFRRVSWDEALGLIAASIRASSPERTYFYMTCRGEPNENYYAFQKMARAIGTNNVDNAARICHSPMPQTNTARSASPTMRAKASISVSDTPLARSNSAQDTARAAAITLSKSAVCSRTKLSFMRPRSANLRSAPLKNATSPPGRTWKKRSVRRVPNSALSKSEGTQFSSMAGSRNGFTTATLVPALRA